MLLLLLTCVCALGVRAGTSGRVRADVHDGVGRHFVGFTLGAATAHSQQLVRLHQDRQCSAQVSQRGQAHGHRLLLTYPTVDIPCSSSAPTTSSHNVWGQSGGGVRVRCCRGARASLPCTDEHDPPFCGQFAGDFGVDAWLCERSRGNVVSHEDVAVSACSRFLDSDARGVTGACSRFLDSHVPV